VSVPREQMELRVAVVKFGVNDKCNSSFEVKMRTDTASARI